jgi:Ser-tRNA(Ala) deacylase AlaX
MDPRLPTTEHILAKILEDRFDVKVGICKFGKEGLLEVYSDKDLRKIDTKKLEKKVNQVISRNIEVKKYIIPRQEAEKLVNLWKVPRSVNNIRIIDIVGFDRRPCKDEHVDNTSEIGKMRIISVDRVGKDRYRYLFVVD